MMEAQTSVNCEMYSNQWFTRRLKQFRSLVRHYRMGGYRAPRTLRPCKVQSSRPGCFNRGAVRDMRVVGKTQFSLDEKAKRIREAEYV